MEETLKELEESNRALADKVRETMAYAMRLRERLEEIAKHHEEQLESWKSVGDWDHIKYHQERLDAASVWLEIAYRKKLTGPRAGNGGNMSDEKQDTLGSESSDGLGDPVFLYRGDAYNRPVGRGVTIGPRCLNLEDMLPEGDLVIHITAWTLPPAWAKAAFPDDFA